MTSSCKVLLVDDQPANLIALKATLGELDCTLVLASSGEEALRHALTSEFAVILLDLQMPSMDGFEVARFIRERENSKRTPIIFVTATGPNDFPVEEAYAFGAVDYMTKPLNSTVLLSKVSFFIDLYRKSAELARIQQKEHAAALAEKNARIRLILDNARDYAFIIMNNSGQIMEWDGAAQDITGWQASEAIGKDVAILFTPEDLAINRPQTELECAAKTGKANDKRWHLRKDGTRFYADGVMIPLEDEQGKLHGFAKMFRDDTQRKLIETERERLLREVQLANERLTDIFQQAPAFMCVLRGPDHVFEMVNDRYLQLVGKRDLVGVPVRQALPDVEGQGFFEMLDGVYQSGQPFIGSDLRITLQEPDGRITERFVDFVYMPLRDEQDAISGILVHGIDLTQRKHAEQAWRASEERYRTVIESIDEGFGIIEVMFDQDQNGIDYRFLEVNAAFQKHTDLENVIGKTEKELVPDQDPFWSATYGKVALTGQAARVTSKATAMGRWFDVYATRIGSDGSHKVAILFTDITDKKRAEEDLRRLAAELSEANRRKSEFLAVLAHELRNPLAPIRTGLELMQLGRANPASTQRITDMMERQVTHMIHLVDDLLDIARITTGKIDIKVQRLDLATVLSAAVEATMSSIQAGSHELTMNVADEPLMIDADSTRMAQVISNILTNAAKYTPSGGKISLSAYREGEHAFVTIADNGMGIPAESLPHVFEMFSQVGRNMGKSQGGLGIGLSLVRQLVELHGGTVTVSSEGSGKGSAFTIRLPLAQAAFDNRPAGLRLSNAVHAPDRKFRILIADDNVDAANLLSSLLEMNGHLTATANDGHQALEMMREFAPEVAFLDIGMPGLNGYEVAIQVQQATDLDPVVLVALTGWGDQKDRLRSQEAGFDHHLTKPVSLIAINKLLLQLAELQSAMSG
ncbi:response regulator [Oxalobacteraceae bacterium R-40]|uniref:histidine kinase n=1 Tax=Keguizhuia sedimenti TaxID=3064264 RepID=A0ABU1BU12_9BURK|nr:response regulator [Oxalobacteraceae bacterium R-40]